MSVVVFGVVSVAFESTAQASLAGGRGRLLVVSLGPLLPGVIALLSLTACAGPPGFWYWFWTSPVFRIVFVTIVVAMPVWAAGVILVVRLREGWRALDRPLNFAPATATMLFALQTYAGAQIEPGGVFYAAAVRLGAGYVAQRGTPRKTPAATRRRPS